MAQELPIVYVITVCRNAEALIEETMRSVLGQTYGRLRYVVVDGASTDGTMTIVRRYGDRVAATVSEPDRGIYDAMNQALGIVRRLEEERRTASPHEDATAWVNFMNAGDAFVDPGTLDSVFAGRALPNDARVIVGATYDVYPDKRTLRPLSPIGEIAMYIPFCHQSAFTRLEDSRPFDLKFRFAADYDLFYSIWDRYGESAFLCLDDVAVACYRMEGSTSYVNMRRTKGEYLRIRSRRRNWQWWKEWIKWRILNKY